MKTVEAENTKGEGGEGANYVRGVPCISEYYYELSSPRAESARAVTGRRCPHSGKGEDFLTGKPDFFTETAVTPERKVEKSFPRCEIDRHAKGYNWVIDQNWGRMAKIGFLDQKSRL